MFVVDGVGANVFDHTGIAIQDSNGEWVFYDVQAKPLPDGSVNQYSYDEFMAVYGGRNPEFIFVKVPDIEALRTYINVERNLFGKGYYGFDADSRNCTRWVCGALERGGYQIRRIPNNFGEAPKIFPNDLMETLRYHKANP